MRYLLALLTAFLVGIHTPAEASEDKPPEGEFSASECHKCHSEKTPEIVADLTATSHGRVKASVDCTICHGNGHEGALEKSRRNGGCIGCHGGDNSPESRSYLTSKHGVIASIEENGWDWMKPLTAGNYRSPTCAYCHFYEGNHGASLLKREQREAVCNGCHSPRFTSTWIATGTEMISIGQLKLDEALGVIKSLEKDGMLPKADDIRGVYHEMEKKNLRNLKYGVVHHSPDYQWWHGHAALDGKLIHIKSIATKIRRLENLGQ